MPFPRTTKRQINEFEALLQIDMDWGSGGIWEIKEPKQRYAGRGMAYENLKLPRWLVYGGRETHDDLKYLTQWHRKSEGSCGDLDGSDLRLSEPVETIDELIKLGVSGGNLAFEGGFFLRGFSGGEALV